MPRLSLDAIAQRLSEQLQCEQEDLCRSILHQVSRGKPLSRASLATSLQINQNELEHRLFFSTAQAASSYLAAHTEAVLLSIEEAAAVGKRVAASRFVSQRSPTSTVRKKRGMSAHSP